jgi:hypothetical protein
MAISGVERSPYAPLLLDEVGANKTITPSSIEGKGLYAPEGIDMGSDRDAIELDLARRSAIADLKSYSETNKKSSGGGFKKAADLMGLTTPEEQIKAYGVENITEASKRGVESSLDSMGMALLVASRSVDKSEVIEITKSQIEKRSKQKQLYGDGWDKLLSPEMWAETISNQVIPMGAGLATGRVNPKAGIAVGTSLSALQGYGSSFIDTFAQAKAENKTDEEAYDMAVNIGFAGGALEAIDGALPIVGKLGRKIIAGLYKGAGKPVSKAIKLWDKSTNTAKKRLLLSGGGDAITEMASGFLVDVAKDVEGLAVNYNIENYLQEGVVGAGTGTLIGGAQELAFSDGQAPSTEEPITETTTPVEPVAEQATTQPEAVTEQPPAKGEVQPDKSVQLYDVNANFKKNPADYVIYTEEELGDKEKAYIASNTEGRVQFAISGEEVPSKAGQQSVLLKYDPNKNEWAYEDLGKTPDVSGVTTKPVTETTPTQEETPVEAPINKTPVAKEVAQEPASEPTTADVIEPTVEPVQETVQPTPEVSTKQDNLPLNVTGSDGTIVGTDANVLGEVGEADGKKYVKVEYTDPTDGKKKQSIVPQDYVRPSELETQPAPQQVVSDTTQTEQPLKPTETALETPETVEPAKQPVQEAKPTPAQESDVIPDTLKREPKPDVSKAKTLEEVEATVKPVEAKKETQKEITDEDMKSPENVIGISKAEWDNLNKSKGKDNAPRPARKSDVQLFADVKIKGKDKDAVTTAQRAIDDPTARNLSDEDVAGMLLSTAETITAIDKVKADLATAEKNNDTDAQEKHQNRLNELNDRLDILENGIAQSSSRAGASLRAYGLMLRRDNYEPSYIKNQVRKAAKRNPTKEEAREIDDLAQKIKLSDENIKKGEEKLSQMLSKEDEANAKKAISKARSEAIKIRRTTKAKTLEARNAEIKRKLLEAGYRLNDVTSSIALSVEHAALISELFLNNVRISALNNENLSLDALVERVQKFFEDVKDRVPSKEHILQSIGMTQSADRARTMSAAKRYESLVKRQAKAEVELENAMKGVFKAKERKKKLQDNGKPIPASVDNDIENKIADIRGKIKVLSVSYSQTARDNKRLAEIQEKIAEAEDMLDKGITKYPETPEGRQDREDIRQAKERLQELRGIMSARQSVKELQDEIDNYDRKNPLPVEKKNESEALKNAREARNLKRRELQVMKTLGESLNRLENDLATGSTTVRDRMSNATNADIEAMKKQVKELRKIRKERDKLASEPQKNIERERRENQNRIKSLNKRIADVKMWLETGNKENRQAKIYKKTDEEIKLQEEYNLMREEAKKRNRMKELQDKIDYIHETGSLPTAKERAKPDSDIDALQKEYKILVSQIKKEEKAMNAPSPEQIYEEVQDAKLERYEEKITDFLSGVLDEKRNKTEDREDVKEVKEELNNLKKNKRLDDEISNTEKEITDFNRDLEDSKKSNKEKPDIINEKEEILKSKRKELSIMKRLRDSINRMTSGVNADSRDNPKVESDIISSMREDLRILILTQKINDVKSGKVKTSTPKEKESDEIESLKEELSQETKLLNYKNAYDAIKRGVEIAKKKRTEDREDVKQAYALYIQAKNLADTKKSNQELEQKIENARKTGDISELMQYAPQERKPVEREVDMERKKNREWKTRVKNIIQNAKDEDLNVAQKWWRNGWELFRSTVLSGDIGAVARQAVFYANPFYAKEWASSYKDGFTTFFSSENAEKIQSEIKNDPEYENAKYAGLNIVDVDSELTNEELNLSVRLLEKNPENFKVVKGVLKRYLDASSRTMLISLNSLRMRLWKSMTDNNPNATQQELEQIANFINVTTGRGKIGNSDAYIKGASNILLAPRYYLSQLQTVTGVGLYKDITTNKTVRNEMAKLQAGHVSTWIAALGIMSLAGLDVEWDIDDSDFLKVQIGNSRYGHPFTPLVRTLIRMGKFGAGYESEVNRSRDIYSEAGNFLKYKLHPQITGGLSIATGKDVLGREVPRLEAILRAGTPLTIQTGLDTLLIEDSAMKALINSGLSFGGVPVQTYEDKRGRSKPQKPSKPERN